MDRMHRLIAVVNWIKEQDMDFHLNDIDTSDGSRIKAEARIKGEIKKLCFSETDDKTVHLVM